jgi:hypothetical protein
MHNNHYDTFIVHRENALGFPMKVQLSGALVANGGKKTVWKVLMEGKGLLGSPSRRWGYNNKTSIKK